MVDVEFKSTSALFQSNVISCLIVLFGGLEKQKQSHESMSSCFGDFQVGDTSVILGVEKRGEERFYRSRSLLVELYMETTGW